jgi:hypothetical protein
MAEVVTASAQFIHHSTKAITFIKVLQSKVHDIPAEIQVYRHKLEELQALVQRIEADPAFHNAEIEIAFSRCTTLSIALLGLFDELDLKEPDEFDRKTWKTIGGPDKESDLRELFKDVDEVKSILTVRIGLVIV